MISIIKSFFKKSTFYIRIEKTGTSEIAFLMEASDIFKLMSKISEVDVIRFKGDYTLFVGKR